MSIKKEFLKSKPVCKVTFRLSSEEANEAKAISLLGEFNDWDAASTPMAKLKDGSFKATLDLESGREYQFRYLVDGTEWKNDPEADKQVRSPFGNSDNSVISLIE